MKLTFLLLSLVFTTLLLPQGESMPRTWPGEHHKHLKFKSLITADCIKAKFVLGDCVREKLISAWFDKPLVKDCCGPIANHKKSCPAFIVEMDEHLIPHYIKDACHAYTPSPASSPK